MHMRHKPNLLLHSAHYEEKYQKSVVKLFDVYLGTYYKLTVYIYFSCTKKNLGENTT